MVYDCKCNGWMTEKECKECFTRHKKNEYGHVKHCRRDHVTAMEDDKIKEEE